MTVKSFYTGYHDRITDKRFNSPYTLRRYVHRLNYYAIVQHTRSWVPQKGRVLDVGCGDGVLTTLLGEALKDREVEIVGADISLPNVISAKQKLVQSSISPGVSNELAPVSYQIADAENLPYSDESFDVVISSHVLEHLPDFDSGLVEIHRLTRHIAIVALPTCLNLCAAVLLGGGNYWTTRRQDLKALVWGALRIIRHLGEDGVNQGYAGNQSLPHLWRYPWIMKRQLRQAGFRIVSFEAGSLSIPFLVPLIPSLLQVQKEIDRLRRLPVLKNLGYGSIAVLEKN